MTVRSDISFLGTRLIEKLKASIVARIGRLGQSRVSEFVLGIHINAKAVQTRPPTISLGQPGLICSRLILLRAENTLQSALSNRQAKAWLTLEASGNELPAQLRAACKK